MDLDPEEVQQALDNHQAEIDILRFIVLSLFDQCQDKVAVLKQLRDGVTGATSNAPPGTHPETIVELRAHAEFYYKELSARSNPTSSPGA